MGQPLRTLGTLLMALTLVGLQGTATPQPAARAAGLRPLSISFLDVGQGDSTLLQLPDGDNVLVDGGDRHAGPTVVEALHARGVQALDMVIMSHPHADHIGGLGEVLNAFPVRLVLDAGTPDGSRTYRNLLGLIGDKGFALKLARTGMTKDYGPVHLAVLAPDDPLLEGTHSDPNNNSVVTRWTYGRFSLLQTGDIEADGTERLLASHANLQAQVLKVPHHGSRYTTSEAFLAAVKPEVAAISAGAHNSYHHPHREALDRLREVGAKTFVTARVGTITVTTQGDTYDVTTERPSRDPNRPEAPEEAPDARIR